MKRTLAAVAALLTLTACGGSEDPKPDEASTTQSKAPDKIESAEDVKALAIASGIDCPGEWSTVGPDVDFSADDYRGAIPIYGASTTIRCGTWYGTPDKSDDEWVTIAWFDTAEAMVGFLDANAQMGGADLPRFVAERWYLESADAADLEGKADGGMAS